MRVKPSELNNLPPTGRQKRLAVEIFRRFGERLPIQNTRDAYSAYISRYIDDLKTELMFESLINEAIHESFDARRDW